MELLMHAVYNGVAHSISFDSQNMTDSE